MSKNYKSALAMLVSVFFFWGFVAAGNTILIPVFKKSLDLQQWQAQLIEFCFYVAYALGALAYYLIGRARGKDILNTIGYKNGLIYGLLISAIGAFLFLPAASFQSFPLMLIGLFIVGLGFSLQQVAANPLAISLGSKETGSSRLSMAGGVNNVGTTIAPILLSYAIFGSTGTAENTVLSLESVKLPYLILCAAFIIVALAIKFSKIPDQLADDDGTSDNERLRITDYPSLWLGMIGIFVYVGVEVSTAANLSEYLKIEAGISEDNVAPYISLFWGSLMIGRWAASVGAFNFSKAKENILRVVAPLLAFGLFLAINSLKESTDISIFYPYLIPMTVLLVGAHITSNKPAKQLQLFAGLGIVSLLVGMFTTDMLSIFGFISVGLFCSTLWPCVFDLATSGLGKFKSQGSAFLIMMIMGGGFVSVFQGYLSDDSLLGIRHSYWVGVVCFAYLGYYGSYMLKRKAVA
jgi:FHS family L-fucose permease-like MFS transporter